MKAYPGLALVGLISAGFPQDAAADVVEITISIDAAKCESNIQDPRHVAKSVKSRDLLVWSFKNECTAEQEVLVCALKKIAAHAAPWKDQYGVPAAANLGRQFKMKAGDTAKVFSNANVPPGAKDTYCVMVFNKPVDSTLRCPTTPTCPPFRASELAMEVLP